MIPRLADAVASEGVAETGDRVEAAELAEEALI